MKFPTLKPKEGEHSPKFINPDTKIILSWLGRYYRAIETEDFVYFVNFQEGDENACVKMYRKSDWSLASDNYFGYNDMFELVTERPQEMTYVSRTMKTNIKLHWEAMEKIEGEPF